MSIENVQNTLDTIESLGTRQAATLIEGVGTVASDAMSTVDTEDAISASACSCEAVESPTDSVEESGEKELTPYQTALAPADGGITLSDPRCITTGSTNLTYAIGILGYDFATEANRDAFQQLMPRVASPSEGDTFPANPFDPQQMVKYLKANPAEARELIWTLNLDLTPIYAIRPQGAFSEGLYNKLVEFLDFQLQPIIPAEDVDGVILSRTSIPGTTTGETVRLFSGQTVPVLEPQLRGMYIWKPEDISGDLEPLKNFLERIYYELYNLGQTSADRALNYSATNAFQSGIIFRSLKKIENEIKAHYELDSISAERSRVCRRDSDCWDVKLTFFAPENIMRAKIVYRFTIDVSCVFPVLVGPVRSWSVSGAN